MGCRGAGLIDKNQLLSPLTGLTPIFRMPQFKWNDDAQDEFSRLSSLVGAHGRILLVVVLMAASIWISNRGIEPITPTVNAVASRHF